MSTATTNELACDQREPAGQAEGVGAPFGNPVLEGGRGLRPSLNGSEVQRSIIARSMLDLGF